ncbi:MAG: lamin tail domain-containing protein [Halobacterium sp.]
MARRSVLALALVVLVASAGCAGGSIPEAGETTVTAATTGTQSGAETTTASGSSAQTYTVTVTEVVDGDTLDVQYANGTLDTVRLIGVDTPETYGETSPGEFEGIPDTDAGHAWLSDWGHRASDYVRSVVEGETVTLVLDEAGDTRGYYGRLLAYVRVNSSYQLNYVLVADGYARVYDSEFAQRERFYDAEAAAQASDVGLWGFRESTTTSTASGGVEVVGVHADAAGTESENLNDEYVVLENTGSDAVSVGGWTVTDAAGHEYVVPAGFELAAGARVTLHTGRGTDTGSELYWGRDSPVWNNGGDTVTVRDSSGDVVDEETYA